MHGLAIVGIYQLDVVVSYWEARVTTIQFRGISAHFDSWGKGPPLILLHAGASSGAQWQRHVPLIGDDFRLIAPDLVGFGRTEAWRGPGELSHDLQADLVAAIVEQEVGGAVDVVGHSYGGATALRLALRHRRLVRSLVLIEPIVLSVLRDAGDPLYGQGRRLGERFIELVDLGRREDAWALFVDHWNGEGTWAGLADTARERFLAQTAQTRAGYVSNLAYPPILAACRTIDVPTTIVRGAATTEVDCRIAEVLHETIPGSRYRTIVGAGHMSPFTHPADVARIVREHVRPGVTGKAA
jgi:lipase